MSQLQLAAAFLSLASLAVVASAPVQSRTRVAGERIAINDNRAAAGTLDGNTLTIHLEAREGEWHPDDDNGPAVTVYAFGEAGKPLSIPGPLIRVTEGTAIHAFIRNAIAEKSLIVYGLSSRGANVSPSRDTIQIAAGQTREVRFAAGAPGTYYYWGSTATSNMIERYGRNAELSGAFIVDPRGARGAARDRVMVINLWSRDSLPGGLVLPNAPLRFTINGKAWPNTERLSYAVGDSVRFRIVNTSAAPHPMHLHGFYFNVDSRGDGTRDSIFDPRGSAHNVVTDRVAPGQTMTLTWVPERAGNWLFHCHDNYHMLRNNPLDGSRLPPLAMDHAMNHPLDMMGGLVMGISVRPAPGVALAAEPRTRRALRLFTRVDSGGTTDEPAYGYVLEEKGKLSPSAGPLLPGPTIVLTRGEPVSITVVNELPEATAVHWHGIELDSYYDGVAGFAGHPGHIAPPIAPRDSFIARFTPPRSGTFIYHPHADEVRQQQAGLAGAIVVVDSAAAFDPEHDVVMLLTVPRREADRGQILLNGSMTPPPRDLRVGERYRFRIVDIHTFRPSMVARIVRDSTPVTWRAVAKDGMVLPADQATQRPAVQQMGNGETYDFELVPSAPGDLRFTVSSGVGLLLVSQTFRVR
jgi:FtsP/CotA-like multicopper oxidase with cupredoxin domain